MRGMPRIRKSTHLAGVAVLADYVSFNNNTVSLMRAVKERVFYVLEGGEFVEPPRPVAGVFGDELMGFTERIRKYLPCTAPISRQTFVDLYTGRKKIRYQDAKDSLDVKPFSAIDALVEAFVKWEKLLVKAGKTLAQLVPRVISPRSFRFNVMVGVFLKPLEKRLFKAIAEVFGEVTVFKGMDAEAQARAARRKWDMFDDPIAVGADASRFDQHVSVQALQWEHSVYTSCFRGADRDELAALLKYQLRNKCVARCADGKFKYETEGGRMSGDMNTGMGNCLIMCALMWTWFKRSGVGRFSLMNNGDDCVMIVERRDLQRLCQGITPWFRSMGFTLVTEEPVYDFERIQFCQTNPVFDGRTWIMVRDPNVALSKDSISMLALRRPEEVRSWMYAVGCGGLRLTGGIPVFQNFYRAYLRHAEGTKSKQKYELGRGFTYLLGNLKRGFIDPSPEARYSFWLAFGIHPLEQIAMEQYYDTYDFSTTPAIDGYYKAQLLHR